MRAEVPIKMHVLQLPHLSDSGYRLGARALVALGACFWLVFGVVAGRGPEGVEGVAIPMVLPGIVLAALLAIAWRWELIGGVALLSWALLAAVYYPLYFAARAPNEVLFCTAALCLPPLLAGFLFLGAWGRPE